MTVKTSWAAGDVLLAADLTDTFAAKAAYPSGGADGNVLAKSGTGTVWANAGKILQVVMGTTTTATTTTSTTPADTTLTATITPTSATSKILVIINQSIVTGTQGAAGGAGVRVVRGSTVISSADTYSTFYLQAAIPSGRTTITMAGRIGFSILDSPATASAVTYKTQARMESGGSSESATTQWGSSQSQIILMEVAA